MQTLCLFVFFGLLKYPCWEVGERVHRENILAGFNLTIFFGEAIFFFLACSLFNTESSDKKKNTFR
jgi:hypothetical protein